MRFRQAIRAGLEVIAMLGVVGSLATPAHAAPPPHPARDDDESNDDDDGPKPTGEIVITAKQLDAARASVNASLGASSYLLTNDTLEKRPSGESANLVNVLLQMPGVSQGGDGTIRVRGQDHLQYRINNIILPEGLSDPADTLRARFADRIELVTGALPAQYGLQTGGIVNITTKSGVYEHGGEVELYGGTQGRFEPAFELAGSGGGTNYYVSGSYLRSDAGLPAPDASAVPLHDHTDQGDALVYIDRILDAHSRVALIFGLSDDALQTPHPRDVSADGFTSAQWGGIQRRASQYSMLSYQRSEDALTTQLAAFVSHGVNRLEPDTPTDLAFHGIARRNRVNALSAGVQGEAVYALGEAHHLRVGMLETWRQTRDQSADTVLAAGASSVLAGQVTMNRSETGLYLQDEWRPVHRLTFNYGLRFDHVSGSGGGSAVSPRANLVWEPYQGTMLHIGYARYFVPAPQIDDAIDPARHVGTSAGLPTGNGVPALAEWNDYIDIGITRKIDGLTLGVDGWWKRARNLLDQTWSADGLIAHPFNYAHGTGRGLEFSATWSEGPLSAWGNLAVSRIEGHRIISGQAPFTAAQLAWAASHDVAANSDQRLSGSAGLAWKTGPLRLSSDATWGSGLPRSPEPSMPNIASMPSWISVNFAAVYRIQGLGHRPLDLRLDLLNAFDTTRRIQDGTSLVGGMAQWTTRRGIFIGLEQVL